MADKTHIRAVKGRQIRAARALLGWQLNELADKVSLSREAIGKIEDESVQPRAKNLADILRVFDESGIEFMSDRGVALRDDQIITLKGENVFFRVLDDVIVTMRDTPNAEVLFACVDDRVSPPAVIENYRRLRKAGIAMRSLVKEGDTYLMGNLNEYRYLPEQYFHNNTTLIYGNKFATMILDSITAKDTAAIIINNVHVAAAQRNLFHLIWSSSHRPTESTAGVRYDE